MGNPKQKWTAEEEEALRAGIAKHGTGKWKNIQRDPEFNHLLHSRSNIDLKDKWRNLSIANGIGSRTQKAKVNTDAPATPLPKPLALVSSSTVSSDAPMEVVAEESKCLLEGKTASKYDGMISEALAHLKDPNGADTSAIVSFIEQRHEVPSTNFRKLLGSRLRKLVAQDKLEKVQNCYRIKKEVSQVPKASQPKVEEVQQENQPPKQAQTNGYIEYTVEEAAIAAASFIAEAENKAFVAAESVKEAERVSKLSEETDAFLQLAKEIFDRCSNGELVMLA